MLAYPTMRSDRLVLLIAVLLLSMSCRDTGSPFTKPVPKSGIPPSGTDAPSTGGTDGTANTDTTDTTDATDATDTTDVTGPTDGTEGTSATDDTSGTDDTDPPPASAITVGTWNLHNFSAFGAKEFRLDDISTKIAELSFDVLAVQEIKVADGSNGDGEQAWDVLLDNLSDYDGVHAPYNVKDTTVGLLWNTKTTTLVSWQVIFEDDWWEFPRAPVEAVLESKGETFTVVVLHLKAFKDSVDRRRAACEKLVAYIDKQQDKRYVIIGDFNDDPYDPPDENSFTGTFLDAEPDYHFVTASMDPESVSSTGYYHYVDGTKITGEFLDHVILRGELYDAFSSVTPEILGLPEAEYTDWQKDYSDHFPVVVTLTP